MVANHSCNALKSNLWMADSVFIICLARENVLNLIYSLNSLALSWLATETPLHYLIYSKLYNYLFDEAFA